MYVRKKPFIVEFTGTPEAGKTTVINIIFEDLKKLGYKAKLYPESAEITPKEFPKGCLEAKLWMNFDTAKNILEAQYLSKYDIVLFDRGAFDRIFWIYLDSVYNPEIAVKNSVFNNLFKEYPSDLLVAFYVSIDEAIRRRGGEGRLVTKDFIYNYNTLFQTFISTLETNKFVLNTTDKTIEEVVELVENSILENLKSHS